MYVDPGTGGIPIQASIFFLVCGIALVTIGGVVAAVTYFLTKGKKKPPPGFTKDSTL
jgi:hypothetical protein